MHHPERLIVRLRDQADGIGLIEMMIAILIIGVVLSAMASSLVTSLRSVQRDQVRMQATALGNELLEELQALEFREAAFYSGEASAEFGTLTHDGEAIVVIPDESPRDPAVPEPGPHTVTRDGTEFTHELMLTWVDSPRDGQDGSDADGDTQDYKRLSATLSWDLRGQTRTAEVEALRAPSAGEQPLGTSIDPDIVPISARPDGRNAIDFTFSAQAEEPQQSVKVTFEERDGDIETEHLTDTGGGRSWEDHVSDSSHAFANGEMLVTFTATAPDGDTIEVVDRVLFLHTLDIRPDEVTIDGATPSNGPDIEVTSAGACPFTVTATVTGALASDSVTATWSSGPGPDSLLAVGTTDYGADFALDYEAGAGFPVPADVGDTTLTDVALDVVRGADNATHTLTIQDVPVERVSSCS